MATKLSSTYTNQTTRNESLFVDQSLRGIQTTGTIVRVEYTCDGTEANADVIKLCIPRVGGFLLPEASRITNIGAGDCDLDLQLRKVNTAGTATAISAATSIDNNSIGVARLATAPVEVSPSDALEVLVSNRDASASGELLIFELVFAGTQHA